MKHPRIIYGLLDPLTDEIRYIGRSSSGLKRAKHHMKKSVLVKDFTHKGHWLKKLGLPPVVLVLEEVYGESLAEREVWWIAFGRSEGWPLTNETDGGEGGHTGRRFTPEHRARISAANKGRQLTEEQRAKLAASKRGKKLSPDHKAKLLASWKGQKHSEETKKRIGDVHRGKTLSPETRKKISDSRRTLNESFVGERLCP